MKRFVVGGVQRAGTTLMTTSLDRHPEIRCVGELFKMRRPRIAYVNDSGYRAYLDTAWHLCVADRLWSRRVVYKFLNAFFEEPNWEAIGFKLMCNQMRAGRFPMLARYLIDHQVSVIHVIRANVFKPYLSRLSASRRRVYHATQAPEEPPLHVPIADLRSQLMRIETETEQLREIFQDSAPYLRFRMNVTLPIL